MDRLAAIFHLNRKGFNLVRGLTIVAVLLVPLIVLSLIGQEKYWLSVSFAALFVALSDPGGCRRSPKFAFFAHRNSR